MYLDHTIFLFATYGFDVHSETLFGARRVGVGCRKVFSVRKQICRCLLFEADHHDVERIGGMTCKNGESGLTSYKKGCEV